jgi:hypothetical protein
MNKKGIQTAIDIASDYFGIHITENWLLDHFAEISLFFPLADDPDYTKEFPKDDCWWTFRAECESGGLYDTSARDRFGDALANILTNMDWPLYGDSEYVTNKFNVALKKACHKKDGIYVD